MGRQRTFTMPKPLFEFGNQNDDMMFFGPCDSIKSVGNFGGDFIRRILFLSPGSVMVPHHENLSEISLSHSSQFRASLHHA